MADFAALTLTPVGLRHEVVRHYLAIKNNHDNLTINLVCIEGLRMLTLAYEAGLKIESLFVCPELLRGLESKQRVQMLLEAGVATWRVSAKVMNQLTEWEGPDGLAALVQLPRFDWSRLRLQQHNAVLVLDGLQNPGNVGTIIRCADGAGIDAVIITGRQQRPGHPKIVRASMGSLFTFPVIDAEATEAIHWLKQRHFRIITTDTAAGVSYRQCDYRGRIAIVMGNERHGISRPWSEARDGSIAIPMLGRADSLNVGNAAVLVLYEMIYGQGRIAHL